MTASVTSAAPNGLAALPNMATGSFTSAGGDVSIVLGFNPRYVKVFDESGTTTYEKVQGDLPENCWKNAAGATTVDTSGLVTFPADTGLNEPGSSIYLTAALVGTGKVISWVAFG